MRGEPRAKRRVGVGARGERQEAIDRGVALGRLGRADERTDERVRLRLRACTRRRGNLGRPRGCGERKRAERGVTRGCEGRRVGVGGWVERAEKRHALCRVARDSRDDLPREARSELSRHRLQPARRELEGLDHATGAGDRRRRGGGGVGAQTDRVEAAERDALLGGEGVEILDRKPGLEEERGDRAVGPRGDVGREQAARVGAVAALGAQEREPLVARGDAQRRFGNGPSDQRANGAGQLDLEREARGDLVADGRADRCNGAVRESLRDGAPHGAAQQNSLLVRRGARQRGRRQRRFARRNEAPVEPQQHAGRGDAGQRHARLRRVLGGQRVGIEPRTRREIRRERVDLRRSRVRCGLGVRRCSSGSRLGCCSRCMDATHGQRGGDGVRGARMQGKSALWLAHRQNRRHTLARTHGSRIPPLPNQPQELNKHASHSAPCSYR